MALHLHITAVPEGEAPLWVREQWVGLALPLAQKQAGPVAFMTSGVVSGPKGYFALLVALFTGKLTRRSGYLVEARLAVAILASHSKEAAAWWQENAAHQLRPGRCFLFARETGHVGEA